MSYGNTRRPVRRQKDYTALILALVTLIALPALGYAVYKFVLTKPPVESTEIAGEVKIIKQRPAYPTASTAAATAATASAAGATGAAMTSAAATSTSVDPFAMAEMGGMMNANTAVARVCKRLKEATELRKALVVWLFDRSPSCDTRREEVLQHLKAYYPLVVAKEALLKPDDAKLMTVVGAFAGSSQFVLEEPTSDPEKVAAAVAGIKSGSDGNIENTFAALEAAVKKYAVYAEPPHLRSVSIVVVTDEIGDDQDKRDAVSDLVQRSAIPVYVIGSAATFGSTGQSAVGAEGMQFAQGPESRQLEWINLESGVGMMMMQNQETNVGPYSLANLCSASGGEFYPVTGLGAGVQLPPQYLPKPMSEKDYQAMVTSNKALAALIEASKLPAAKQLTGPELFFSVDENGVGDPAVIQRAQQPQALLKPAIDAIFDKLKEGERDRPKLTEPRHQAGFDLAMGRIMAAKVRTEGYGVLLAAFKAGRKGTNPATRSWRLEAADGIEKNSVLEGMAKKAREYLEGVIKNHPNTPWAAAAQQELATPIGWKWIEG